MQHQSSAALRCEKCGLREADGVDDHGYPLCLGCGRELKGERIARREDFRAMLGLSLTLALSSGLPESEIRRAVAEELEDMLGEDQSRGGLLQPVRPTPRGRGVMAAGPDRIVAEAIARELRAEASRLHRRAALIEKVAALVEPPAPKPTLRYELRQRGGRR